MQKQKILSSLLALPILFTLIIAPIVVSAQTQLAATGKLAVTTVGFDNIGAVLSSLGFSATEVTEAQLTDLATLQQYSSIYINCSDTLDGQDLDAAATAVREFVNAGGTVYASDYANSLIAKAFPGKINFYAGEAGADGLGRVGDAGVVSATVTDPGLAAVLGTNVIEINFDLPSWAIIDSVGADVTIHMTGPANVIDLTSIFELDPNIDYTNPESLGDLTSLYPSTPIGDKPFVVSFSEGAGEVLYTSFHNEAQTSSDLARVLNWFAIRVLSGGRVRENRDVVSQSQGLVLQEVVDSVSPDGTKEYAFVSGENQVVDAILNFDGGELKLTVINSQGQDVFSEAVTTAPFTKTFNAPAGTYTARVDGLSTNQGNTPFVLTLAKSTKTVTSETTQAIAPYLGLIVIVIAVLAVLGTILLVKMMSKKPVVAAQPAVSVSTPVVTPTA
jgi:hypothetical protein